MTEGRVELPIAGHEPAVFPLHYSAASKTPVNAERLLPMTTRAQAQPNSADATI